MKNIAYIAIFLLTLLSTAGIYFFYVPITTVHVPYLIVGAVLIFAIYLLFYKSFFSLYFNRQMLFFLSSAAALAIFFLISSKGPQDYLNDNSLLVVLLVYIGSFFIVTVSLAVLFFKLKDSGRLMADPAAGWELIVYFLLPFLTGLFYFLAFFPAAMTVDSFNSWGQIQSHKFNDWHPVIFTWTILLLTSIWHSPAIMSLFQDLVLALVFAYSFWQFRKLGVRRAILIGMCLVMVLLPPYGIYIIIIWKDILYSAFLTLFTVHLFLIMYSKGDWLRSKINQVFFFLSSFGVIFYRHNGFPVYLLTMVIFLAIYWKKVWKRAGSIFLILMILHQLLVGPIFQLLHVVPSDPNESLAIPTQQIAFVIKSNGVLTAEQKDYFNQILPLAEWKQNYFPTDVNPIKFSKNYNRKVIFSDVPKYLKNWAGVVIQNPLLTTKAFLNETLLVWKMGIPKQFSLSYYAQIYPNTYGLKQVTTVFTGPADKYLSYTHQMPFTFFWRPALYAFIILFFSILLLAKHGWRSSIVILPFLLNMLSVAAALPAQDFRYLLANVYISLVLPLMVLIKPKQIERDA